MLKPVMEATDVVFYDLEPHIDNMLPQILASLSETPKRLSPKFFYDEQGSKLFEEITQLDEYYPTRTECGIYRAFARDMAELAGEGSVLLELGSGSSNKIRLLLEALQPTAYVSADISKDFLLASSEALKEAHPNLDVRAICLDYTHPWEMPVSFGDHPLMAFFPGSTIGNFEPEAALDFLKNVRHVVGKAGSLLIGVDLVKDHDVLNAAYDDAAGVTAAFNLNILTHLNKRLGCDFNEAYFKHVAFYNGEEARIEMHLEALVSHKVRVGDQTFEFTAGERMLTEYSHKYTRETFGELANRAGFEVTQCWTDERDYFAVFLLH